MRSLSFASAIAALMLATAATAAPPNPAELFKTGVAVEDSRGVVVGSVSQVVNDASGQPASLVVEMGRLSVSVPTSSVTRSGQHLVAANTRTELQAQAKAAAKPK